MFKRGVNPILEKIGVRGKVRGSINGVWTSCSLRTMVGIEKVEYVIVRL